MQNALCILIFVHMSQEGPGQIQVNSPVDPEGVVHLTADGHLRPAHRCPLTRVHTCRIGSLLASANKLMRFWSTNSTDGHIVVDLPPCPLRFSSTMQYMSYSGYVSHSEIL